MQRLLASALALTVAAGCTQSAPPSPPPLPSPQVQSATTSAAASAAASPASSPTASAAPTLPIPARAQAAESPPSGWCGETAIQEGLLYLGVWAPQRLINKAGSPAHPDLYSNEIPAALSALGVRFTPYAPRARGYGPFARWAAAAIDDGRPVLAGVKILPTQHPEWGLDHFVLVVGHGERGLLVNTTWGRREWVSDRATTGLSFANAVYGLRLDGVALPADAKPARITLLAEGDSTMTMSVACDGLTNGVRYRIEQRTDPAQAKAASAIEVTADAAGRAEADVTVEAARAARFQCVPAS